MPDNIKAAYQSTAYRFIGNGDVWRLCLKCGASIRDLEAWEIHDAWHRSEKVEAAP